MLQTTAVQKVRPTELVPWYLNTCTLLCHLHTPRQQTRLCTCCVRKLWASTPLLEILGMASLHTLPGVLVSSSPDPGRGEGLSWCVCHQVIAGRRTMGHVPKDDGVAS